MTVWLSKAWLAKLPSSGAAFDRVKAEAARPLAAPQLGVRNDKLNCRAQAKAILTVKGVKNYSAELKKYLDLLPSSGITDALSLGRQLAGWLTAADLIGYRPVRLMIWAARIGYKKGSDPHPRWPTLEICCRDTCNNWGMFCLSSFLAASLYVEDAASVDMCEKIFRGACGEPMAWRFRPTSDLREHLAENDDAGRWLCPGTYERGTWTGVNAGCDAIREGCWVEDVVRGGSVFPSVDDNGREYIAESLHGALHTAAMLAANGHDAWNWSSKAMLRACGFWNRYPPNTDYTGNRNLNWIANGVYGAKFPTKVPGLGRQLAFCDYLFS